MVFSRTNWKRSCHPLRFFFYPSQNCPNSWKNHALSRIPRIFGCKEFSDHHFFFSVSFLTLQQIQSLFSLSLFFSFFFWQLFIDEKLTCATALAKATTSQLDEVAGTLVNIFAMKNRVTDFVRKLTAVEVSKTGFNFFFRFISISFQILAQKQN